MKILLAAMFTTVSLSSPVIAQEESKEIMYEKQVMTIYGHDFTLDFPQFMKMHGDDVYQWDEVNVLIPEVLPSFRDPEEVRSLYDIGKTINTAKLRYIDLHRKSLDDLAESVYDKGNVGIIRKGLDPENDPFNLVERLKGVEDMTPEKQKDYLAARFGVWISRDENWEEYISDYNAALEANAGDADVLKVDPYAFQRSERYYRMYKAMSYLENLVGASPEYQAYLEDYNASKEDPSP